MNPGYSIIPARPEHIEPLPAIELAAATLLRQVTLTTFRGVPWNMPFYARLGFEELPRAEWPPPLRAIVADEAARGLDPERRVVMIRTLGGER